jgi:formylglycine-generating enzyme required for sulfatase activity
VLDVRLSQEKELFISKGTLRLESPTPRMNRLRIRTPHADAHGWARNLGLSVDMDPMTGTFVEVRDGEIQLSDRKGNTVSLKTGEGATVATREALVAKPLSPVLELGEGVRLELVQIRAGSFTMGSGVAPGPEWQVDERPEHKVTISRGYYLGKYHVTREQFAAFVKATGYRTEAEKEGKAWGLQANGSWAAVAGLAWQNPGFPQTKDDPVTCVSWSDAKEFCDWATKRTGRPVRLPTEAEWEYACRAGTKTKWSWGDDVGAAVEYAWLDKNSGRMTHPVGQKKPNPWGLGDMHGHVWEWCQDWGGPYAATDAVDPTGPVSGDRRILRGGDWYLDARYARSAFRNHAGPSFRDTHVGFRVAVP